MAPARAVWPALLALLALAAALAAAATSRPRDGGSSGAAAMLRRGGGMKKWEGDKELELQQRQLTEALANSVPAVAHVGLPTCPAFPWCPNIPSPTPSALAPTNEALQLPFQNVPGVDNPDPVDHALDSGDAAAAAPKPAPASQ
jgi:hypothetical protein